MTNEGWELIDENDELVYYLALEELEKQRKRINTNPDNVFMDAFWNNELLLLTPLFVPVFEKIIAQGAQLSIANMGTAFVDIEVFRNAAHFAEQYSYNLIKNINNTTRDKVSALIQQHILEDLPLSDIEEQLTPIFGSVRASLIAVTESTRAYNHGALLISEQLANEGILNMPYWYTVNDSHVCEGCLANHDQPKNTTWSDPPPLHTGCRCFIINRPLEL